MKERDEARIGVYPDAQTPREGFPQSDPRHLRRERVKAHRCFGGTPQRYLPVYAHVRAAVSGRSFPGIELSRAAYRVIETGSQQKCLHVGSFLRNDRGDLFAPPFMAIPRNLVSEPMCRNLFPMDSEACQ